MIKDGATPKLTISDRESNCFPNADVALKSLAINPSKKSITAAIPIKIAAQVNFSGMLKLLENSSFINLFIDQLITISKNDNGNSQSKK